MRGCLLFLTVFLLFGSVGAKGQVLFEEGQVVLTSVEGAASVYTADLDGDGDNDLITKKHKRLVWHENLTINDFSSTPLELEFGEEKVIYDDILTLSALHFCDLDNDGDIDILSSSRKDHTIAWYENKGSGDFGNVGYNQIIIANDVNEAVYVYADDIDGDGDMDVLSASSDDRKIIWYENEGSGSFVNENIVTYNAFGVKHIYTADFDNDRDLDVLATMRNKVVWYKNEGGGNFNPLEIPDYVITTDVDDARQAITSDIDNDGDIDVVSISYDDNKLAWYKI